MQDALCDQTLRRNHDILESNAGATNGTLQPAEQFNSSCCLARHVLGRS